jgi:hypothetical protein
LNSLLGSLKEFFVPVMSLYLERSIETLSILAEVGSTSVESMKRKRDHIEFIAMEAEEPSLMKLLTHVISNVETNFSNDSLSFIQVDIFERICTPVTALVIQFLPLNDNLDRPFRTSLS